MTGQRVGSYEIVRVLARGGMAVVYLARQPALERDVVLKRVDLESRDPTLAHRFVLEAQLAGALGHPNIVTLYDFLEADGVPYIAMEFVAGGTLRSYIGALTLPQVFGVLDGVLAGLDHAEQHSIAHRDLKPENVLITLRGGVKLADFGIARAYNALTQRLTSTGMAMGTPAYMAPEQALNETVGPFTDLYAVGVMAYEMLAGSPPFEGGDTPMSILYRHVNEPVPPLRSVAPDVSARLRTWVEWLLAKSPVDRPQSADEASEGLDQIAVTELGAFWRRQAPVTPRASPSTGEDWETYGGARPPARPSGVVGPAPEPTPSPSAPPEPQVPQATPSTGAGWKTYGHAMPPGTPEAAEPPPEPPPPPPPPATPPESQVPTPPAAPTSLESAETRVLPVADGAPPFDDQRPTPPNRGGHRRWVFGAAGALVAAGVAAVLLFSGRGPAPERPRPAAAYDFLGEGRQQPVVGIPDAGAGRIVVLRPERQPITADRAGVQSGTGADAKFGFSLTSGDFDGDGLADIAIGAHTAAVVVALYGTREGIGVRDRQTFRVVDSDGAALAAGDLNRDGRDDLIISVRGRSDSTGRLQIRFGAPDGLPRASDRSLEPPDGSSGFGEQIRLGDVNGDGDLDIVEARAAKKSAPGHTSFCGGARRGPTQCETVNFDGATSLAVGDVNGDDFADIVQGDTGPDPDVVAGKVRILKGSPGGPDTKVVVTQESLKVPGTGEPGDKFGETVSVGHLDRDRYEDIVVGAPRENDGKGTLGKVTVIRGGPDGHARKGHRRYVHPDPGAGTVFGKAVAVLDIEGDGSPELLVGAALPNAIQVIIFRRRDGRLRAQAPIEFDVETGAEELAAPIVRLGRDLGG